MTDEPTPRVPFLCRLSPDDYAVLAACARREDRSMASVVREALRQYVVRAAGGSPP